MTGNCLHLHIIGDDNTVKPKSLADHFFDSCSGQGGWILGIKVFIEDSKKVAIAASAVKKLKVPDC